MESVRSGKTASGSYYSPGLPSSPSGMAWRSLLSHVLLQEAEALRPAARQAHDDLVTYLTELMLALFDGT